MALLAHLSRRGRRQLEAEHRRDAWPPLVFKRGDGNTHEGRSYSGGSSGAGRARADMAGVVYRTRYLEALPLIGTIKPPGVCTRRLFFWYDCRHEKSAGNEDNNDLFERFVLQAGVRGKNIFRANRIQSPYSVSCSGHGEK